jgi:uroporphyrinogen decarboxylase
MTSLERVRKVLRGDIPDCVPISLLSFQNAARFAGFSIQEYCLSGERMADAQLAYWDEFGHDVIDIENGVAAMAEAVGCKVEYPENEPPWIIKPAIESLDDIDSLPEIDPFKSQGLAELVIATKIVAKKVGQSVCIRSQSDQGPFSLASMVLGLEKFLMALVEPEKSDLLHKLLSYAARQIAKLCRAQIQAGSHYTMIGDSLAGPDVCSPKTYREYAFPYEKFLVENLRKESVDIGIHICGNATPIIEDMVKTGAPYFELDYKVDRKHVRRVTDGKITIFGTLDPSGLLCNGTSEEIARKVREDILLLGQKGYYVLSPGCTLPGSTPVENIRAFVEAGRKFGRYGKDGKLRAFKI